MTADKAARLAAIRAANAQKAAPAPRDALPAQSETADTMSPAVPFDMLLLLLLAVVAGATAAVFVLPVWLPGLSASLLGPDPKAYWYLSRASALVAYALLWLAMALGLSMTNRLARLWPGGPTAFDLHQYTSLLGLAFALFHGLILMGDHYINYTLLQLLVPFATAGYRPIWVGLGQLGAYLLVIVSLSFYVRGLIGRRLWRIIHYLSFVLFLLALVHGVLSGTDSPALWARGMYWLSGGSVLFLTVYRVLIARRSPATGATTAAPVG